MDKVKTLEVLRGMKFMQRKEEAKRRAAFEVAQREQIERQLLHPGTDSSGVSGGPSDGGSFALRPYRSGGQARATVLYDDTFPAYAYGLSRRSFTEAMGGGGGAVSIAAESETLLKGVNTSPTSRDAALDDSDVASGEEVEDLWGGVDDESAVDYLTAAPDRRRKGGEKSRACRGDRDQHARSDGRFIVKSSLRAPKLPRRLQESVEEQERQRKRKRAEGEGDAGV
ncbi:hypothetical protein GH5_04800 [Leishmania sp. Ghana 2012 LV757]|uniref:hypothetical protein n=1 Tax=Leishmania sp. Ghana 2012 LV757 TaxID=2803181 RepID=UPI001B46D2C6|nr:hypothetical protein GH5_04800 [Leishmania sp. Ghana 2012 LV757]